MGGYRMSKEIVARMTNLADSGQNEFVEDYSELAKLTMYEMGISNTFINSNKASYFIAKIVTDLVEDGNLSKTTELLIQSLRVNHPRSEDADNV